jgi:amidohydrolase
MDRRFRLATVFILAASVIAQTQTPGGAGLAALRSRVEALTAELHPSVIEIRRDIHRHPELGFREKRTSGLIADKLRALKFDEVRTGVGVTGVVGVLKGGKPGPVVAVRADMDALPIQELNDVPYKSTVPNVKHACGHDGHMATLLGVAAILNSIKDELPVCVKLIWQPAEEGGGGAARLVEAGVLDGRLGPKVSAIFGLHGWPGLKVGTIATKPGALLAATDNFLATFIGKGCHGAYPHLGADPIVTACEAVLSVQQFVSRETDPTDSCVVTVGKVIAGTAVNIIPDSARIEATVRTLTREQRTRARERLERRMRGVALANGCELQWQWNEGYPATINDPAMADYVAGVARQTFGDDRFIPVARSSMGGEDFSYYLEKVPGCFFLIGVEPPDRTGYPSLHSDRYDFTDAALAVGMRMFVELVRNWR